MKNIALVLVSIVVLVGLDRGARAQKAGGGPRLSGAYLVSGTGIERAGINPEDIAKGHAGFTAALEADGEGNAQIVFYTGVTDAFGLTDGFAATKNCTYVEGNPGPAHGRILCQAENPLVKVIVAARYTINRSGQRAVAAGVIFVYTKIPTGEILTSRSDLTFLLEQERM